MYLFLKVFSFIILLKLCLTQTETNETGLLSDLWSSLTSIGKVASCPGECVHAITSIFCDNVLEEVTCGSNYLRCCVPHEYSYGTPVETSPPIVDEYNPSYNDNNNGNIAPSTPSPTMTSTSNTATFSLTSIANKSPITSPSLHIRPNFDKPLIYGIPDDQNYYQMQSTKLNIHSEANPSSKTMSTTTSSSNIMPTTMSDTKADHTEKSNEKVSSKVSLMATESTESAPSLTQPCPGICIALRYAKYCSNILSNGQCIHAEDQCCLQSQINNDSNIEPIIKQTSISSIINGTNISKDSLGTNQESETATTSSSTPLPLCEGTCVAPLFSLLCDETDYNLFCPNGGSCCVNKESTTEAQPQLGPCPGTCIPIILSGMCNRPSQLILKTTDCASGTICCDQLESVKESTKESDTSSTPSVSQMNHQNYRPVIIAPNKPIPSLIFPLEPPITHTSHAIHRPHNGFSSPKPQIFPQIADQESAANIPHVSVSDANEDVIQGSKSTALNYAGGPPFCTGPCIAPMFKFTCFGGNAIYPKFQCSKAGQICCSPMTDIQAFEANVLSNNGIWKPNIISNSSTAYDDSPIKPLPKKPNPYMCGIKGTQRKETPRVVGGSDSYTGEWCWQVALINNQNQYLCGGALIGAQWVLTAAHCITNLVRKGEVVYVRVGDYDLTSQMGSRGAQTQRVSTTYIHHNHNGQTLDNDIALLKLQTPVELNEAVCLVCLPARGSKRKPGKRCTVTGYGYQDETGPIALKIREALVPVVDDQECTVKINAVTEKLFILPASSFCAGGDEGNDACQGDGGGPLNCEVDGYYELTGLVSWGFGCGRRDVPGVYVKVSSFVGWINQIISVNNQ